MPVGAGDADPAGFERLAQRFERGTVEFGQFVEKQHTLMGERDLARPCAHAAADKGRQGGGMMRLAKWPLA